jgi:hypothetical protein
VGCQGRLGAGDPQKPHAPRVTSDYFKSSFAALLALSAPEPPPLDLLLLDPPPDPFFEVPPAFFSANFLASFPIFSAMRAEHAPYPSGA